MINLDLALAQPKNVVFTRCPPPRRSYSSSDLGIEHRRANLPLMQYCEHQNFQGECTSLSGYHGQLSSGTYYSESKF